MHSGDTVTYTIVVTNSGDSPLSGVTVSDNQFPTQCSKDATAMAAIIAAKYPANPSGTLKATDFVTYTCDVAIIADVTNTATATGTRRLWRDGDLA